MKNNTLIAAGRLILKELVIQCTDEQQHLFKRLYSPTDLTLGILDVIDAMDPRNIDQAITQCEKTIFIK
jgi:hypothetical protein